MRRPRSGSLSRLIGLASAVLIVMGTVSLVHVGLTASGAADTQAAQGERMLFESFLRGRLHLMSRDQLSLAQWERSVENVVRRLNRRFLRTELFESLWYDFSLNVNIVVAADGAVVASALRDEVVFPTDGQRLDGDLARFRDRTVERYFANRIAVEGGFRQKRVSTARVAEVAEVGFAAIDGVPHVVSAMAIVPGDGDVALADGPPMVLISARPIDETLIAEFSGDLGFRDLVFVPAAQSPPTGWEARTFDGRPVGVFTWTNDTPGARIWRLIVPLIVGTTVVSSLAVFFVARHMGRLSRRLEASEAHNRHIARYDALSGSANRREIEERLGEAVAGLPERPFAWIACDLDRFKAVNDTYGHAAGDAVIRAVADRLRKVVGSAGTIGRIGGDEFVVLVTAFCDRRRLAGLGREIVAAVRAPFSLPGGGETDIGVSLGIARVEEAGVTPDVVVSQADAALYAAKQRGRSCAVFAHETVEIDDGSPIVGFAPKGAELAA